MPFHRQIRFFFFFIPQATPYSMHATGPAQTASIEEPPLTAVLVLIAFVGAGVFFVAAVEESSYYCTRGTNYLVRPKYCSTADHLQII